MRKTLFYLHLFLVFPCVSSSQIWNQKDSSTEEDPIVIDAEDSVVCNEGTHTCVATGKAKAQKGDASVRGDTLTVHFSETENREITAITADGNVRMEAPDKSAQGDHLHYDPHQDHIRLTGHDLKITTPKLTLTAKDSIDYWHKENKSTAHHAVARLPEGRLVQADTLTAYFKPEREKNKTEDPKAQPTEIDQLEGDGHFLACGPNGTVTGDRGTYDGKSEVIEVFGHVIVTQGKNIIKGEYGRANLKTEVAEILSSPPDTKHPVKKKSRISGLIFPNSLKHKEKESFVF